MANFPAGPYNPTNELVAEAWLAQRVAGLSSDNVGMTLPRDVTKWLDEGFLQVRALASGAPDIDIPVRRPILTLDAWACSMRRGDQTSIKPAWNLANRLIELVRVATEDAQTGHYGKPIDLPAEYRGARVQAAYLVTEPMRVPDDPSGYAHLTADLAIDWVPA